MLQGLFNSDTFKTACTKLSHAIKGHYAANGENYDPRLRPLCNHMSTSQAYCDYETGRYTGAYLSQCSESGGDIKACAGLPFEAVTFGVFFNTPNWNGENYLGIFAPKKHMWLGFDTDDDERFTDTLCVTTPPIEGEEECEVGD